MTDDGYIFSAAAFASIGSANHLSNLSFERKNKKWSGLWKSN
jgi:hypothetical protein